MASNTKQRYWFIDRGKGNRIGIVEKVINAQTKEGVTTDYQPISEVKAILVYCEALPGDITVDNASTATYTDIPNRFIEGIVSKVIADCYRDPRNMNGEGFNMYEQEFNDYVQKGKKYKRRNFQSGGTIKPHDF